MQEVYPSLYNKPILIHPGETAENNPGIHLNSNSAVVYDATGRNSIVVAGGTGTSIQGPLSLQLSPDQWRVAGLWKVNPLLMSSLPSTLYTPVPWMRQSFPEPPTELIEGITSIASMLVGF